MNLATTVKVLARLTILIFNPQVVQAYANQPFIRNALICRPSDPLWLMGYKILCFFLVCGRIAAYSTSPMYWIAKVDRSLRAQLAIAFRPTVRRKLSFGKYDGNSEIHIPHYNGDRNPKIPSFKIGQFSAKVILIDQSTIIVHGETEDAAIKMVNALLQYVLPHMIPKEPVITVTKRRGKALKLTGREIKPFRGDYYPPATQVPEWSIHLS